MKLFTFRDKNGTERAGALYADGARIADLAAGHESLAGAPAPALASLQSLIEGGADALDLARRTLVHVETEQAPGTWVERDSVQLLAPLPRPVQMRDFMCFEQHLKQSFQASMELVAAMAPDPEQALEGLRASGRFDIPAVWYEIPVYYKCNRFSVVGTGHDVRWPGYANLLDYELELAAVIGKGGVDIPAESARISAFWMVGPSAARSSTT